MRVAVESVILLRESSGKDTADIEHYRIGERGESLYVYFPSVLLKKEYVCSM